MTSGEFHSVLVASISVDRANRHRKEIKNVEELASSINGLGLIHPLVITRENALVAGERRLTAITQLGWTHVPCQYTDELDPVELELLELEENTKRLDLTWQERAAATTRYHELKLAVNPDWNKEKTAKALGITRQYASTQMDIHKSKDPLVKEAKEFATAKGIINRQAERQIEAANLATLKLKPDEMHRILNKNFTEWALTYDGPKFNLIHCDFPYGIGADKFNQGAADTHGGYTDTFETYQRLVLCLRAHGDRFISESAHLIFWFSMVHYRWTLDSLSAEGWTVDPFPLVWFRADNSGILPDPNRGPRRVYETAFFCHRGDRKIVRAVSNLCASPSDKSSHMSVKPVEMLTHFFRMVVDENTTLLDPTCGSGSAIRAAKALKAKLTLGLEINDEFSKRANLALSIAARGSSAETKPSTGGDQSASDGVGESDD
jgi:ParB family transcriptional regulator, chromosome partitioning protein